MLTRVGGYAYTCVRMWTRSRVCGLVVCSRSNAGGGGRGGFTGGASMRPGPAGAAKKVHDDEDDNWDAVVEL